MKKTVFLIMVFWVSVISSLADQEEVSGFPQPNTVRIQDTEHTEKRRAVAVLSVDAGESQAIADLLMARLQEIPALTFVERERLDQITREQQLALSGKEAATRISVGSLVGADVLVLVGRENTISGEMIRVLVCDSATGARIGQGRMAVHHEGIEPLADTVEEVLSRFSGRVETVVTVMDFISHDLEGDYAHLQKDLAELIRQTLSSQKGIAVVEIDEARSISREMALRGGEVRRVVPLRIIGEYRTHRLAEGGPRISMTISIGRGDKEDVKLELENLPVDRASHFLMETVRVQVKNSLGDAVGFHISLDEQFNQFVQRADEFSGVGDFERAGSLREAAVLLRPHATAQRIQLIRDYDRWLRHPIDVWPRGASRTADDPYWRDISFRGREIWRRTLFHVEYLIRNQLVTTKEGLDLFTISIYSINGIKFPRMPDGLGVEEQLKKDFIRNLVPLVFRLEGDENTLQRDRNRFAAALVKNAFERVDGFFLARDDFQLIEDLLCDLIPGEMLQGGWLYQVGRTLRQDQEEMDRLWLQFATRLTKSDRPIVQAYGMYVIICLRHSHEQDRPSEELLAEVRQLIVFLDTDELKKMDTDGSLRRLAAQKLYWMENMLDRLNRVSSAPRIPPPSPVARTRVNHPGPKELPDGSLLCERVRLKPLEITLRLENGEKVPLSSHKWRVRGGGLGSWRGILPAWEGVDIIYSPSAVLFVDSEGMAREVLVNDQLGEMHVVFDGKYVWAASGWDGGIYVIDERGETVAHISQKTGLPPANSIMWTHVIEEGKILASGNVGTQGRGWLAVVSLEGHEPSVNVIHEAIKVSSSCPLDPHVRFRLDWITEHRNRTGDRWFFVGRGYPRSPFVIEEKTMEVTVYPVKNTGRSPVSLFPHALAYHSHGGKFYTGGGRWGWNSWEFEMDSETLIFKESNSLGEVNWPVTGGNNLNCVCT